MNYFNFFAAEVLRSSGFGNGICEWTAAACKSGDDKKKLSRGQNQALMRSWNNFSLIIKDQFKSLAALKLKFSSWLCCWSRFSEVNTLQAVQNYKYTWYSGFTFPNLRISHICCLTKFCITPGAQLIKLCWTPFYNCPCLVSQVTMLSCGWRSRTWRPVCMKSPSLCQTLGTLLCRTAPCSESKCVRAMTAVIVARRELWQLRGSAQGPSSLSSSASSYCWVSAAYTTERPSRMKKFHHSAALASLMDSEQQRQKIKQ